MGNGCRWVTLTAGLMLFATALLPAQQPAQQPADDPVRDLVARLDLEKYKATIKGLTQFGDRRQGTDRNRAAIDWIEAQLKSYGCTNTARIKYHYQPARAAPQGAGQRRGRRSHRTASAGRDRGGAPQQRLPRRTGVNNDPDASARREAARAQLAARPRPDRAKRSTARRSARRCPARCTSSAGTWTASATAKPRTTTARAPRS